MTEPTHSLKYVIWDSGCERCGLAGVTLRSYLNDTYLCPDCEVETDPELLAAYKDWLEK